MDKLVPALERLADKLGVAANHIYIVLTRQAIIRAWVSLVLLLLLVSAFIVLTKFVLMARKADVNWEWDDHLAAVLGMLFLGVVAVVSVFYFLDAFPLVFNPEAGALNAILGAL